MSRVQIKLTGYGYRSAARALVLTDDTNTLSFSLRPKILFGIKDHARAELNMHSSDISFFQHKYKKIVLLKRIISLGIVSRRMFSGIFNGFELTAITEVDFLKSAPRIFCGLNQVYVSRSVGRVGIRLNEYRPILEYSIRRRQVEEKIFLLHSSIEPLDVESDLFHKGIKNVCSSKSKVYAREILDLLPEWHGLRTYFALLFNDLKAFQTANVFKPTYLHTKRTLLEKSAYYDLRNSDVTFVPRPSREKPIFFLSLMLNARILNGVNIVKGDHLYFTDTSENQFSKTTSMWPALNWSLPTSNLIAVPPFDSTVMRLEDCSFLQKNTNWAHFIEDIAPRAILFPRKSSSRFVSEKVDEVQRELLDALDMPESFILNSYTNLDANRLNFVVHENVRNRIISGEEIEDALSVDVVLMKEVRNRVRELFSTHSDKQVKIFLPREKRLFRKLVNQNRVVRYFVNMNFEPLFIGDMPLRERVSKLSNCRELVYVYGAAGVNAYFCPDDSKITELRHPGVQTSKEHLGFIAVTGAIWTIVHGKRSNILQRVFYGSDSWRIRLPQ